MIFKNLFFVFVYVFNAKIYLIVARKEVISILNTNLSNDSIGFTKKYILPNQSNGKNNAIKISALVDKSVTLTCSIDLDDINFFKKENYKIMWSREVESGKDYEPLGLDDIRLISDERIQLSRSILTTKTHDQIQWNLVINYLKLTDSKNYICQLNKKPYDSYWLKKFHLNINEPAYFVDENDPSDLTKMSNYENSIFVKSVNEFQDLKLKCNSKGKPKPNVSWYLKYANGTSLHLDVNNHELVIKNLKRTSKIDRVECQVGNGYGPKVIRSFKINIKHAPVMNSKAKVLRVAPKTNELRLNCSVLSNPLPIITWQFIEEETLEPKQIKNSFYKRNDLLKNEWKSINKVASYSLKYTHDYDKNQFQKLPLSKYHISEKHQNPNHLISILEIKALGDKDFGTYRCIASNDISNTSIDFKIKKLNYDLEEKKSLMSININDFRRNNDKKFRNSKFDLMDLSDEHKYDDYSNEGLDSSSTSTFKYTKCKLWLIFTMFFLLM